MKNTINTNIAPYDFVGRPKPTKKKKHKNKKSSLPETKMKNQTKNLKRQGRDVVKQNEETKKKLRTSSMERDEQPRKTCVTKWKFKEQ